MKIPLVNLPQVRQEFYQLVQSGYKRNEIVVFRLISGHGKAMLVDSFVSKYGKQYHDLCVELKTRQARLQYWEILYVWAEKNGGYDMGVIDNKPRAIQPYAHS